MGVCTANFRISKYNIVFRFSELATISYSSNGLLLIPNPNLGYELLSYLINRERSACQNITKAKGFSKGKKVHYIFLARLRYFQRVEEKNPHKKKYQNG